VLIRLRSYCWKVKGLWREPPTRPYRPRDPKVTSRMMSTVRNRENQAEVSLRRHIWSLGFRYRTYSDTLPGKPDLVFPSRRVAIFVDGDFWHGRALIEDGERAFRATLRTRHQDWWVDKLKGNVDRDQRVVRSLEALGWRVVRVWESDVKSNVIREAKKIARLLRSIRPATRTSKRDLYPRRQSLKKSSS
jgi:DNA mismatch endonuclease, patch repair protein